MMDRCTTQLNPVRSNQQKLRSPRLCSRMRLVGLCLVFAILSACAGGSGSSGFDVSPAAENEAINQVLAAKQCLPGEGLTICPANETAVDVPVPGATPAPQGVDVGTTVDTGDFMSCGLSPEEVCRLPVAVSVSGLTSGAAYQVAARGFDPLSDWIIASPATIINADIGATFTATIEVPGASLSLQVAVLVFVDGTGTSLGEIRTLAETDAGFVFVTVPIPLPQNP